MQFTLKVFNSNFQFLSVSPSPFLFFATHLSHSRLNYIYTVNSFALFFITENAITECIQTGRIVMFELPYNGNGVVATQSSR